MDQDFHYYGTFYAARVAGYDAADATLIAKCSNFIDFLHEGEYGGYWRLVREAARLASADRYLVVGELTSPRYTFQAGKLSTGVAPEDGMWCSYHFTPGNYADPPGTPTPKQVHGIPVAKKLPRPPLGNTGKHHEVRETRGISSAALAKLLNRPMSALSRALLADTIACATSTERLRKILRHALGSWELLPDNDQVATRNLARFKLCLLGARAHVIADTWAHQDWSGLSHEMNTYWDVRGAGWGRQSIDYQDVGDEWKNVVLKSTNHENLQAVPNGTSYLGHGWMGHFPDYSFVKYRYKPCWRLQSDPPFVRNNPDQYRHAFLELCSLFMRSRGGIFNPDTDKDALDAAQVAISTPCDIADKGVCPRAHSSTQWMQSMRDYGLPTSVIDAKKEPDPAGVLTGMLEKSTAWSRYGTYVVHASSDLYLFQIAIDYHFHFVRHWLKANNILEFSGSWSGQVGAVAPTISDLF